MDGKSFSNQSVKLLIVQLQYLPTALITTKKFHDFSMGGWILMQQQLKCKV